jgi:hypothetical protein
MKAAHSIIGVTPEDGGKFDEQLQAPLATGGFGLTSATSITPAAYIAGAEVTLRHSPAFSHVWEGESELSPASIMFTAISDSLNRIASTTSLLISRSDPNMLSEVPGIEEPILPASAAQFVSFFKAKSPYLIQSSIAHRIATMSFIARVSGRW